MATREELEEAERRARAVLAEPTPIRRFGAGVDVRKQIVQQEERKAQATQQLQQVQAIKAQLLQQEERAQLIERLQRVQRKASGASGLDAMVYKKQIKELGRKLGLDRAQIEELTENFDARRIAARERVAYNEKLIELKAQGLTPVFNEGKLVGLRDEVRGQSISTSAIPEDTARRLEAGKVAVQRGQEASLQLSSILNQPQSTQEKPTAQSVTNRFASLGLSLLSDAKRGYSRTDDSASRFLQKVSKKTGVTPERVGDFFGTATYFSPIALLNHKPIQDFYAKISRTSSEAIAEDIVKNPLKNVVTFGTGGLIGAGLKGAGLAVSGFPTVLKVLNIGGKIGGGGALTYFVGDTGYKFATAPIDTKIITNETVIQKGNLTITETTYTRQASKGEVLGLATKDVLLFGSGFKLGQKGFNVITDYARTFRLSEVPQESIIAPEFFKGQKYPQVRRGQTAGQLKEEFYQPIEEIGERVKVVKLEGYTGKGIEIPRDVLKDLPFTTPKETPRAFTASPQDFPSTTTTQKGSSELYGLYGAPRLSATFLKVSSESSKPFQLGDVFTPSKPTALRLNLKQVEFAPTVQASSKVPVPKQNLNIIKDYFKTIGGTGKSVIPAIKTEKEIITAFDTPITLSSKDFFFKFEGRRVPIKVYDISVGSSVTKGVKQTDLNQALKGSSGYARPSSSANPLTSGLSTASSTSSYRVSTSSLNIPSLSSYSLSSSLSSVSKPISSSSLSISGSSGSSSVSSLSSLSTSFSGSGTSRVSGGSSSRSYNGRGSSSRRDYTTLKIPELPKLPKLKKQSGGNINVYLRRYGKERLIGSGLTSTQAQSLGKRSAELSLGKTIRFEGSLPELKKLKIDSTFFRTPKGKTKLTKPFTFIERNMFALNTGAEKRNIQSARKGKNYNNRGRR